MTVTLSRTAKGEDEHYSDDSPTSDDYDAEELLLNDGEMSRGVGRLMAKAGLERLAARINLHDDTSHHCQALSNPKLDKNRNQYTDRANRAVTEQVLDPRTRMILLKMINKNTIYEINGCISTGKEANVYHAAAEDGANYALKIYKTTILTFKAREKYVTGEFRFRHGYSKHNPRKMVQVWAEKEFRNLKRLQTAGIPCPEPLHLKLHVLLMSFIGDADGTPAPRLKDAHITNAMAPGLYDQCIRLMRTMYQECRLVHADFSEYNLLLYEGQIVVIDVSQSVEHDHPQALDFLRHDCGNLLAFFRPLGVATLTLRRLFDFITDASLGAQVDAYLQDAHEASQLEAETESLEAAQQRSIEETVFKQAFIPRTLDEVIDVERDIDQIHRGDTKDLLYTRLSGLALGTTASGSASMAVPAGDEATDDDSTNDDGSDYSDEDTDASTSSASDSEGEDDDPKERGEDEAPLTREQRRQLRKENKVKVRAEKREKRKTKVPKHVKKRREKVSHRRR